MAIERAHYTVVVSDPPYEVRDYDPAVVALVEVSGTRSESVSAGFRLLAGYIFGKNAEQTKIAMTAPVTQSPQSPQSSSQPSQSPAGTWVVRFLMPAAYTLHTLPVPTDSRVHFVAVPARRVAAIRFSGFWSDSNLRSHEVELLQWTKAHHLVPQSEPTYAYYDPPWTPWFMRTIEVLVDVGH